MRIRPSRQWQQDGATDGQVWRYVAATDTYEPYTPTSGLFVARDRNTAAAGNDTLTLGAIPTDGSELIWVNGALVWPTVDYTISGDTISFTSALSASDVVDDYYLTSDGSAGPSALSSSIVDPYVVDSCKGNTASGTSFTTDNLASAPVANDVLVACINVSTYTDSTRDLTMPTGWHAIDNGGVINGDCRVRLIRRVCDGTEGTNFTFNLTGGAQTHSGIVHQVRAGKGTISDVSLVNSGSTSLTAANAHDLPLAYFTQNDGTADGNNTNSIATSGWTTDENNTPVYHAMVGGHKAVTTAGDTVAPTCTWQGTVANAFSAIVLVRGRAVTEDFAAGTMPSDITQSTGPAIATGTGNPSPSLQANGNGQWWYFGNRFHAAGDFKLEFDIMFPSGSRDICNVVFWANSVGSSANGFIFRLQSNTSSDHDSGLYELSGGSHSAVNATLDAVPTDVWLHVTLTMTGTSLAYLVKNGATTVQSGTYDLSTLIDSTHPTAGTVGQASDGAGSNHYFDNFSLT